MGGGGGGGGTTEGEEEEEEEEGLVKADAVNEREMQREEGGGAEGRLLLR